MARRFQEDHNCLYEVGQYTTRNYSKGTITLSVVAMATYFHIITENILATFYSGK